VFLGFHFSSKNLHLSASFISTMFLYFSSFSCIEVRIYPT
jgi:hypothetical protein